MKMPKNRAIYIGVLALVWACAYFYIFMRR